MIPQILFFRPSTDDGAFADLEECLFCALDDEASITDFLDPADDAAVGDDLVVDL